MAVQMASQFSKDGKYFGHISADGKLKIWNTFANSLEQEFTPDFHLSSPCTCLHFIQLDSTANKGVSPKKKKRRESESNFFPNIALGTTSGLLLLYSITKANLEYSVNSETGLSINCLSSVDNSTVYSGSDQSIFVWSLQKRKLLNQWKGGNEKITAISAIPDSNKILTASKNIKLWDVEAKEVLQTFTGHSSDVIFLYYVNPTGKDAYFISGSKADRLLSCWNLNDGTGNKNAVASFLMEDVVQSVSVNIASDGSTNMAATVKSGVVHIYQHTLNGKCNKPFKPKTSIQVVSDTGQSKGLVVTPVRIVGAVYRDDETLCIGHGTEVILTFENVVISFHKKVQCLVRKDPTTVTISREELSSKIHTPYVSKDVHYLTSQTSWATTSKRKKDGQMEVPMEKRLENLTLNKIEGNSKVPKVDNVAQLLVQGLHSKDKNILRTVLHRREENVIRNTVKRLPITLLIPLIQEVTQYIRGKTLSSQIGAIWLKHTLEIHAGILMSNPDLPELLGTALGNIQSRLTLLTPLNRLKGRLDLLVAQVSSSVQESNENGEQPLLIFNDKDSGESDEEVEMDAASEIESEWEEESSEEQIEENNVNSDGSENMSS